MNFYNFSGCAPPHMIRTVKRLSSRDGTQPFGAADYTRMARIALRMAITHTPTSANDAIHIP